MHWIPYALVRICLFFAAGILLAIYQPDLVSPAVALSLIAGLAIVYFIVFRWFPVQRKRLALLGLPLLLVAGYVQVIFQTERNQPDHLLLVNDTIRYYSGIVRSYPESKSKSWKIELEVNRVLTHQWQPVTGRVQLYLSKKQANLNWNYGDELLIKGSPRLLEPPANPGEFDFKRFLSFKNIHHQHFVRAEDFKVSARAQRHGFIYYSHLARRWATNTIESFIKGEQERAIAMALILGVTDGIDTDLVNAYSASGAMHVLAVSGLHVGILYALILFLVKPLNRLAWSRWLIALVSLICLWCFAFVTGLSPSVLRAVTMFSCMAVARPFGLRTNIYNTLAASAFILLLYNPYLIMSVGFQLSYLAVLGIVYLQRPIYLLFQFDSWLGNWIWQITCISIAAQFTTFSLGLLYFHQFPVYFLASNLFVIPLSTFILLGGILLLCIQFIPTLGMAVGWVVEVLIEILNWVVFQTERLPFSLINNVELTTFQCLLLMAILGGLILLFETRSLSWLYVSMSVAAVFSLTQWIHFSEQVERTALTVYRVQGHRAIDCMHHGSTIFIADDALRQDDERIRFHIRPNRLQAGVYSIKDLSSNKQVKGVTYLWWQSKLIAMPETTTYQLPLHQPIDFLIVSHNAPPPKYPPSQYAIRQIVVDASNARWMVKKWHQWAAGKIAFHDVATFNSFVVNL